MRAAYLTCGILSFLLWIAPHTARAQEYYGTEIVSIEVDGVADAVTQSLPISVGDLLTRQALRRAIQALYDRGSYARIEIEAIPEEGGTGLVVHVDEPYFFSTIRVNPADLLDRPLSGYMSLPYGERFSRTRLDEIVSSTRERLEAEGRFAAEVDATYTRDELTRLVHVSIGVDAPPPAQVRIVRFEGGEQTFTPEELADAFDVPVGKPYRLDRVRDGEERLRAIFSNIDGRAGFLDTEIEVGRTWNADSNTVDLTVRIRPGTYTFVDLRGADLSDERVRELVPVFEEGSVDDDLIEEGRLNLLEYLRREGYFEAAVTTPAEPIRVPLDPAVPEDVAIQVIYEIVRGQRSSVAAVRIAGNTYFEDRVIKDELGLSAGGMFSRGVFSPDLRAEAERTIRAMYSSAGFVGTEVAASSEANRNSTTVSIDIVEGRQLDVGRVEVVGNTALTGDEIVRAGDVFGTEVYHPLELESARRAIISRYHALGYTNVRVGTRVEPDLEEDRVHITYEIEEGARYGIGRIIVAGNTLTRPTVICRHASITGPETHDAQAGICRDPAAGGFDPYDPEDILEAQRNLYATGLFNRVDIVALRQERAGRRDVLIQVEDASPLLLTYGVGVQQQEEAGSEVDVRGTVEIAHNNLWGLDRSLSARVQGGRREQRFQATYREPQLFNWDLDGFLSLYVERAQRPQFDASRIDFSVQTLYQFANEDNLLLAASFQTVNLRDIRVNPRADSFPNETGTVQVATFGGSYVRDSRDDPIDPSRGNYFSGSLQVANRAYGSEVNFTSLFTQFSMFRPAKESVIAGSVRFGWNQPYGETDSLPITERYFAGGSTTLRAFGLDEAGVPGGGNALFLLNLEYRFPLPLISGLDGGLFYDTGTVFARISDFSVGDFTHSAGFGLRYQTPLGPIRVDFGQNLNRQFPPDATTMRERSNKLHFTLGYAF